MLRRLLRIAKELGVTIQYVKGTEMKGCYLPQYDIILIKQGLPEQELIYVIAHELTHALDHKQMMYEYNNSFTRHRKMEHEAELKAIVTSIKHFDSLHYLDLDQVNYISFMEAYEIDYSYEPIVKELLASYLTHAS